jgi:hypothetical protein
LHITNLPEDNKTLRQKQAQGNRRRRHSHNSNLPRPSKEEASKQASKQQPSNKQYHTNMISRSSQLLFLSTVLTTSLASVNLPQLVVAKSSLSCFSINERSRRLAPASSSLLSLAEGCLTRSSQHGGRKQQTSAFIEPIVTAMSTIGAFYQNQPYAAAFVTSAVKGVAADLVVAQRSASSSRRRQQQQQQQLQQQMQQEHEPLTTLGGSVGLLQTQEDSSLAMKRNMVTLIYSGIYQGLAMEFVYNTLFPKLFGTSILLKVFVSMFVVSPFLGFPLAYLVKASVFRHHSAMNAMQQYWHDVRHEGLLKTYWMVWIPLQTVAFAVVPQHFRTTFITGVSFCWMIIFSSMSTKEQQQKSSPQLSFATALS